MKFVARRATCKKFFALLTTGRGHLYRRTSAMPEVLLHGYLSRVDDAKYRLFGDNTVAWSRIGSKYWKRGTCKHVNADKTECTFKIGTNVEIENAGLPCTAVDLDGCYVSALVDIAEYSFFSDGKKITGWRIAVRRMRRESPLRNV